MNPKLRIVGMFLLTICFNSSCLIQFWSSIIPEYFLKKEEKKLFMINSNELHKKEKDEIKEKFLFTSSGNFFQKYDLEMKEIIKKTEEDKN